MRLSLNDEVARQQMRAHSPLLPSVASPEALRVPRLHKEIGNMIPFMRSSTPIGPIISSSSNHMSVRVRARVEELFQLHFEQSISMNLRSVSNDFAAIAEDYFAIANSIILLNHEIFSKDAARENHLRGLIARLDADQSEMNSQIILAESEQIKAALILNQQPINTSSTNNNPLTTLNEEQYLFSLIKQRQICAAIAEAVSAAIATNKQFNAPLFADVLGSTKLSESTLNAGTQEEQLQQHHQHKQNQLVEQLKAKSVQQLQAELNKCTLQKHSIERVYLQLKQILANNGIEVPESIIIEDRHHFMHRTDSQTTVELSPAEIENQRELVERLVLNNNQLNDLAKRIISENKDLKKEIKRLQRESTSFQSPASRISTMASHSFPNPYVANFSSPKGMPSPTTTTMMMTSTQIIPQPPVFESINDRFSKSPTRRIAESDTSTIKAHILAAKDKSLEDTKAALDRAYTELSTAKNELQIEQQKNKKLRDSLATEKAQSEIEVISMQHAYQEQLTKMHEQIGLLEMKCSVQQQDRNVVIARLKESKNLNDRLSTMLESTRLQSFRPVIGQQPSDSLINNHENPTLPVRSRSSLSRQIFKEPFRSPSSVNGRTAASATGSMPTPPERASTPGRLSVSLATAAAANESRLQTNSPVDHRSKMSKQPSFSPQNSQRRNLGSTSLSRSSTAMISRAIHSVKQHYIKTLLCRLSYFKRPYWIGVFLLILRFAIHIQVILSEALVDHIRTIDLQLSSILESILVDASYYTSALLYVSIAWNGLFVVLLIVDCVLCQLAILKGVSSQILICISFTARIYIYALFMPSVYLSLEHLQNHTPVAIINLILTPIVAVFVAAHDQDFSFHPKDSLAKRQNIMDSLLIIFLELANVISKSQLQSSPKQMLIMPFISVFIFAFLATKTAAFEKYSIRILNLTMYFFLLLCIAVIFASLFYDILISFSVIILSCAIFSLKAAKWVIDRSENLWKWRHAGEISDAILQPEKLDYYLRLLIRKIPIEFSQYYESNQSMILELLTVQHQENCYEYPDCFCSKQEIRIQSGLRRQFLVKHVRRIYYKHIRDSMKKRRSGDVYFCLSYLNFLVEVYQDKIMGFSEIIRLKGIILNLSLRQQALFFSAFQKANAVFSEKEFSTQFQEKKKGQWDKEDSYETTGATQARSKSYIEDVNVMNFYLGIEFDERLNVIEGNFNRALEQKSALLLLLFSDHIDLFDLKNKGTELISVREQLKIDLINLFRINYSSHKLTFYTETFTQFFGFGEHKRSIFNKQRAKQYQAKLKIDPNIFTKSTCVVFLTLISEVGKVKHVQNKFENIFGYPQESVIGKNISMILPTSMRKLHEEVLLDFMRNPENSTRNTFELLIAQNIDGWAVPVSLKFKPDNIQLEDCGLTGFLEKPASEESYIQTTCGSHQIECISQNLYESVFAPLFSQSDLYRVYLNRIIPLLGYFEQHQLTASNNPDSGFDAQMQTIAFLPKSEIFNKAFIRFYFFEKLDAKSLEQHLRRFTVEHYDIYLVKLCMFSNQYRKIKFNVLEINSFKKIVNYDSQKEALINFKAQLKSLLKINIDIQKELEIIDTLKELQLIHQLYPPVHLNEEEEEMDDSQSVSDGLIEEQQLEPIQAPRDLSFKEDPNLQFDVEASKYSQQQLYMLSGNTTGFGSNFVGKSQHQLLQQQHQQQQHEIGDSQTFQGMTHMIQPNKYQEISEINMGGNHYQELDQQQQQQQNITSFNHLSVAPQELQIEQINSLQLTGMVSPLSSQQEQGLNSPLSSQAQLFSARNTLGIASPRLTTQQIGLNSPHHTENIPLFKKSANELQSYSSTSIQGSQSTQFKAKNKQKKSQLLLQSFQSQSQQQLLSQPSHNLIEHQASTVTKRTKRPSSPKDVHASEMSNILTHFYNQKYKPSSIKKGISLFSTRMQQQFQTHFHQDSSSSRSYTQHTSHQSADQIEEQTDNSGTQFLQMLKERVRQAKNLFSIDNNDTFKSQKHNSINELTSEILKIHTETKSTSKQLLNMESKLSTAVDNNGINSVTKFTRNSRQRKAFQSHEVVSFSEGMFSNSDADGYQKEKQELDPSRILNQATSSLHSSQTQNQEHTKAIIRQVNSKKRNVSLVFLIIFGVVALATFSALVVAQYIQNVSSFNTAELNFKYLPWPLSQRFFFSRISGNQMTRKMVGSQFFSSFSSDYLTQVNEQIYSDYQSFKENTINFFYANLADTTYFKYAQKTMLTYTTTIDTTLLADKTVSVASEKRYLQNSMQYFMLRLIPLFYRTYHFGSIDQQIPLSDNFVIFLTAVNGILALIQSSVLSIISTIQSQALTIMVLVIVCVFILGLTIIPLNVHIQRKNEEVLKLFATLSSLALNNMYYPIQVAMNTIQNTSKSYKFSIKTLKKRKANSTTSSLPKINIMYFVYITVGIILMIIQPIVSFIYITNFYTEADVLSDITATLYNTKAYCISLQSVNSGQILYQLGITGLYNPSYFAARITSLNAQRTANLNKIYQYVQKTQATTRYEQSLYDEFFFQLTSGDICAAMKKYPQYISSSVIFDADLCETSQGGLLTQGFQIAVTYIANTYYGMTSLYAVTGQTAFQEAFVKWETTLNLKDLYDTIDLITATIEVMKDFLTQRILNFIQDMKTIFLILLIYQLGMMAFIFYFGYIKFYINVERQMFETKRILNVLSIESVIENPYIISYLSKQD